MGSDEGTLLTIGHALGTCCTHLPLSADHSQPRGSSSVQGTTPLLLQLQWLPRARPQRGRAEQEVPHNLQQRAQRGFPGNATSQIPKWTSSHHNQGEANGDNNKDKNHQNNYSCCTGHNNYNFYNNHFNCSTNHNSYYHKSSDHKSSYNNGSYNNSSTNNKSSNNYSPYKESSNNRGSYDNNSPVNNSRNHRYGS